MSMIEISPVSCFYLSSLIDVLQIVVVLTSNRESNGPHLTHRLDTV